MATPTNLPATFVAGNVLTAAQLNDLRGAFRITQTIVGTYSTQVNSSVTAYADTGLTATITPQSTSSKILVLLTQNGIAKTATSATNGTNLQLNRAGSAIWQATTNFGGTASALLLDGMVFSGTFLDAPATTSAVTYKTQFANAVAGALVAVQTNSATSTIILMEISL